MSRVPTTRSLARNRARSRKSEDTVVFQASPGTRRLAAGLFAILAVMFVIHQTQIEGTAILLRLMAAVLAICFAAGAWYFWRRGSRGGPVLEVGPDGFGIAVGFEGWLEFPWEDVEAFRYWEPTGLAMLVKRRQARWVGVLLNRGLSRSALSWDQRFEIWLNTFHNRPGLCILHPFVKAPILDVLQAFKDHAPARCDYYKWMSK